MTRDALAAALRAGRYADVPDHPRLHDDLVALAYDRADIGCYAFAAWRAARLGTASAHLLACEIAAMALTPLTGAYSTALHHAREAVALAPTDPDALAQLLFFHTLPDRLLDATEAHAVARRLLAVDPDHAGARKVLGRG